MTVERPASELPAVLVAEDDGDLSRIVTAWLSHRYQVIVARDGDEALTMAHKQRPVAALVDVMLPKLSGAGLQWAFAHHPRLHAIPIAFVTAYPDASRALPPGSRVLEKPFQKADLEALVDELVQSSPAPAEVQAPDDPRRRLPRVFVVLPASLEGERTVTGMLLSLSQLGVCFQCGESLPGGSIWTLRFDARGQRFELPATVRYNFESDGVHCAGLALFDLGLENERKLEELIHALMLAH